MGDCGAFVLPDGQKWGTFAEASHEEPMEVSRQVRRAMERKAAKARPKDWTRAIHEPPPQDPPHCKGVSDRVIAQRRGCRSDWK